MCSVILRRMVIRFFGTEKKMVARAFVVDVIGHTPPTAAIPNLVRKVDPGELLCCPSGHDRQLIWSEVTPNPCHCVVTFHNNVRLNGDTLGHNNFLRMISIYDHALKQRFGANDHTPSSRCVCLDDENGLSWLGNVDDRFIGTRRV